MREQLLIGSPNPALESIEKDFANAQRWLLANDKNLRSVWTTLQAADKLKDLDDRLTKAFASKMAVAIFRRVVFGSRTPCNRWHVCQRRNS